MSAQQLLAVLCLVFLVGQTAGFVVQSNEYCPINPRKAGQALVQNGEAFSFLLTCPLGQPKWGVSQGNWQELYYSQSANSYAQSSDTDVFLYQSAFTNGVNDPRQGACVSWEHAFRANVKAQIFTTGSGKPIIVGQDRRFEASELFVNNSYGLNSLGQWLYSICDDVTCSDATVPKPFWGRRIGEPLFQDTMAELAYFPFPPDWAYNSPRLGTTLLNQDQYDSGYDNLNPSQIASTYVYNDDGDKLLVLLVNGQFVGKNSFTDGDGPISDDAWFLTWCQDEDCNHWGVFALPSPTLSESNFNGDSFRPAITTGADGQTIYVVTRASLPQTSPTIFTYKLVDISPGAEQRNIMMTDIYYNLIGGPAALDGLQLPSTGPLYQFLTTDYQITIGSIGPDVHPLNYAYGGRGYRLGNSGPRRPAIACVDLEDTGVQSDPWCTWTTYWEYVDNTAQNYNAPRNAEPSDGAFFDIVYDECADNLYVISSSPASSGFTLNIVYEDGTIQWPPTDTGSRYFSDDLNIAAPYPWLKNGTYNSDIQQLPPQGRRVNSIAGANGRPFFTWADLDHGLYDSAPVVWGTCAIATGDRSSDFECRTIMDSIELGTMGYVHTSFGQTLLLSAPDGLPVMIYWFDHFGGSPPTVPTAIFGSPVQRGLVTNKPLIVMCLDTYCDAASVATFTPAQLADIVNRPLNNTADVGGVNPYINVDATFADDELVLLINEGGRWDEGTANPLRLWRTNRWASPTGLPCTDQNAGETAVADGVVYYCTRIRVGSDDAELYVGTTPRPWTRLFEWVRMDWGYPLRNLGGFIGWGASYGDDTYVQISTDKDPWWTDNAQTYLNVGGYAAP